MPVFIGAAEYPENILENLKKDHKVYTVNATEEAKKLGNSRVFNLIVLGIAAQHMDFTKEQWYEVIEKTVPPKTIKKHLMQDINYNNTIRKERQESNGKSSIGRLAGTDP